MNDESYENHPQSNSDWLASLRTWHYFRIDYSVSCSCYDITVIKIATHLVAAWFYQIYHWKHKLTDSLLLFVVAQFITNTTNLKKAIYLHVLQNKSYMLLTSKKFVISNSLKKIFCSRKWSSLNATQCDGREYLMAVKQSRTKIYKKG